MVTLFFIIFLVVTILLKVMRNKKIKDSEEYTLAQLLSGLGSIILFIWVISLIYTVGTGYTIDDRIAMYEEENASIEESINITVSGYMDYETSTYGELKGKDAINLVSLYPELKSDTLVQQQIEVYVANNDKIKELKEEKIELSEAKWKLYFGR